MRRIRQALVTAEVAGSLVLLVGCGLMIRSVSQMMRVDLGFNPIGLSRSRVMLKAGKYADGPAYSQFYEAFAARLATGTGSTITFSSWPPYVEAPSHRVESDGGAAEAGTIAVSPGYFALFSIAIPRGRAFSSDDRAASSAIVSETLARNLWPGGDGVGRRVRAIDQTGDGLAPGPWRTVVGIARDVRQAYDDRDRADLYTPKIPDGRYGTFYLRASASRALFDALRSTASAIDADAVISEPRTLADDDQRLAGTRFMARLLAGFAGSAAFLAMLGVYGVTAYAVEQRRKEVAIRMALGASGRVIVAMFLRQSAWVLGASSVAGAGAAIILGRIVQQQVFGVQAFDMVVYAGASALLIAVGLAAAWWPARRAAAVHPSSALNAS
jgi:predicted permease